VIPTFRGPCLTLLFLKFELTWLFSSFLVILEDSGVISSATIPGFLAALVYVYCQSSHSSLRNLRRHVTMVHYGKEIKAAPLAMSKNPKHGKEQPAAPESPSSALRLELLGSFEVYVLKGFLALPPFPPDLAKIMGPQRLTFPFGTDFEVFVRKVGGIIFRIDDLDDAKKFVIKNGKAERVESGAMEMELRFCYVVGQHSSSNPGCTHTIPKTISSYEDYREMLEHMASVADDPDGKFVVIWQVRNSSLLC
jgi:hypothetical protein